MMTIKLRLSIVLASQLVGLARRFMLVFREQRVLMLGRGLLKDKSARLVKGGGELHERNSGMSAHSLAKQSTGGTKVT